MKKYIIILLIIISLFNPIISNAKNDTISNNDNKRFSQELSMPPKEKITDLGAIKNNLSKWSVKDERAKYLLDNFNKLDINEKYLAGNDQDTIEFVYNARIGNTDFNFEMGPSKDLGRNTPYYIQWDNRWAYIPLHDSLIGFAGCGPTSMAMVLSRLCNDPNIDPIKIAQDAEPFMGSNGISWTFFPHEASRYGFKTYDVVNTEDAIVKALEQGPVIVSVAKGYFTVYGHIIVIDSYKDGKFVINDPNSIKNSKRLWDFEDIYTQFQKIWLVK